MMAREALPDPARRRLLRNLWKAGAVVLALEAGWTSYDFVRARRAAGFGEVVDVGSEADLMASLGEKRVLYSLAGRCYVTKVEGQLYALYQKCPHLGCKVPFCESSGWFECPCHGSRFNRKGEWLAGPAPKGMWRFPLEVRNGRVLVDTGKPMDGPPQGVRTVDQPPLGPHCA
jgi:cytochrome b6-f complex iron-sulfur subunit